MKSNSQLAKRSIIMASLFLMVLIPAFPQVNAAGGTTGKLNLRVDSVTEGNIMYIELTELTVSADYSIELDDDPVFNWTTSAVETSRIVNFVVPNPGVDDALKIELIDANVTVVDTAYLQVSDVDDLIPDDMVQDVFIALIGLFLFAGILIGLTGALIKKRR